MFQPVVSWLTRGVAKARSKTKDLWFEEEIYVKISGELINSQSAVLSHLVIVDALTGLSTVEFYYGWWALKSLYIIALDSIVEF